MLPWAFYNLLSRKSSTANATAAPSAALSRRESQLNPDLDDDLDDDDDEDLPSRFQAALGQKGRVRAKDLPPEAFLSMLCYLDGMADILSVMLVCRQWSAAMATAFYLAPRLKQPNVFGRFTSLIVTPTTMHPYSTLVQRLDIGGPAADELEIGDLETVLGLCQNITAFKLTSCLHVSSILLQSLADFCPRLQSLELRGCPVGDGFLPDLVGGCPSLRLLDLSESNVRVGSVLVLLDGLQWLEKLTLDTLTSGEAPAPSTAFPEPKTVCERLQHLSLASGTPLTPNLIRAVTQRAPFVSRLNLSASPDVVNDDIISAAVRGFKYLTWLEADWCPKITDVTLQTIAIHRGQSSLSTVPMGQAQPPPFWKLAFSGTSVSPSGVKLLARACLEGLAEIRLDGCARLANSYVEAIAVDSWIETETARKIARANKAVKTFSEAGVHAKEFDQLKGIPELLFKMFSTTAPFQLYPEVAPLLRKLQEPNASRPPLVLGVISDSDSRTPGLVNALLSETGDSELRPLDFCVTSYQCGASKPDQAIFDAALERIRYGWRAGEPPKPEECLHIGDSFERDFEGARKAGWKTLLLRREGAGQNDAVPTISTLEEITKLLHP
ncbi:hypothetical protein HDU96_007351 [Phlyctochytrium bullatum]|nr:hypothetical protein HDU96_007351 [Phlyctochytrium bullatum]